MHAGAYWADLGLNYCAKCDLKDTGASGLLWGTVPNVLIGLTPWVDNFMHLGGFITGAAVTVLLLPELRVSATVVNPYDPSGVRAGVKASPGPPTLNHLTAAISAADCLVRPSAQAVPKKVKSTPLGRKRESQVRLRLLLIASDCF